MEIDKSIDFDTVLNQVNAYAVYLDRNGRVKKTIGKSSIIGFKLINNNNLFLNILPQFLNLKEDIDKVKSSGVSVQKIINYILDNNNHYKLNLTISIVSNQQPLEYLLTFVPINHSIQNTTYNQLERQLAYSEEKYNSYFENDPVMHISVNPKTGLIVDCNSLSIKKMGLKSKQDLIGIPVYKIYATEDKNHSLRLIEKFNRQGFLRGEEMEIKSKNGNPISVLLYTTAVRDENNEILHSKSTLVDITDLKKAEKVIQKKNAHLEILNNKLEQFVSTCSHDLQEPLATIKFAASILQKTHSCDLNEQGNKYLDYIDTAVDRLSDQIKALLEHSRIGNNAEKQIVNINDLLNTVIVDLGKSISKTNTKIVCITELPKLNVFKTEFRLLLQNIISNSIKYTKEGVEPYITIKSTDLGDFVKFSITDNGIGISEIDKEEVFRIFNKVNNNNPNKGSGVGLAHCKKIVQMHSGNISVNSTLGKGSEFCFTILK